MVQFLECAVLVIVISASGVMAPGPLFAANISYGLREGVRAGIKMAIGHTIVELPLVVLLVIGVFSLESFPEFRTIISIFGAITLFVFTAIQFRTNFTNKEIVLSNLKQSPLIAGIVLSVLNPFFINILDCGIFPSVPPGHQQYLLRKRTHLWPANPMTRHGRHALQGGHANIAG